MTTKLLFIAVALIVFGLVRADLAPAITHLYAQTVASIQTGTSSMPAFQP
jgi:hypothetical protein